MDVSWFLRSTKLPYKLFIFLDYSKEDKIFHFTTPSIKFVTEHLINYYKCLICSSSVLWFMVLSWQNNQIFFFIHCNFSDICIIYRTTFLFSLHLIKVWMGIFLYSVFIVNVANEIVRKKNRHEHSPDTR